MAEFMTHKGVNNPPFLKGFPMSYALYMLGIFFGCTIIGGVIFSIIFNYIISTTLTLFFTVYVCYKGYTTFIEIGPFGLGKFLIKYFKPVEKIIIKRPKIEIIKLIK